jgi:hypothetical protein
MDTSILTSLYQSIDPWIFWPALGAVLVLTNWSSLSEIWSDFSPARRHAQHAKESLELELLRHEIAALRKSNNLLQADIDAVDSRTPGGSRRGGVTITQYVEQSALRRYGEAFLGGLFGGFAALMADLLQKGDASASFAAQTVLYEATGLSLPPLVYFLAYVALGGMLGLVFRGRKASFLKSVLVGAAAVAILFSLIPVEAALVTP